MTLAFEIDKVESSSGRTGAGKRSVVVCNGTDSSVVNGAGVALCAGRSGIVIGNRSSGKPKGDVGAEDLAASRKYGDSLSEHTEPSVGHVGDGESAESMLDVMEV